MDLYNKIKKLVNIHPCGYYLLINSFINLRTFTAEFPNNIKRGYFKPHFPFRKNRLINLWSFINSSLFFSKDDPTALSKFNNRSKVFRYLTYILILLLSICSIECSGLSVQEERDVLGRIIRKATYRRGKLKLQVETKYLNNTVKPLIKVYKKLNKGTLIPWWMEVFSYENDRIDMIKFFITVNEKKTLSGKIDFQYNYDQLKRIEYYSINDIKNLKLNRHGFDLYYYTKGVTVKRRIIEYEYNPETDKMMQVSQYVIYYKNNKINSMDTKMLDRKSIKMLTKDEVNIDIITEMIRNIEKSLRDRCKGTRLLEL